MTLQDDRSRLLHMLEASQKAILFTEGKKRDTFYKDAVLYLALIRLLEIIGEAAVKITEETRSKYPEIPWQEIISMRNRLIHGYFDVNPDIVWQTIKQELPFLIQQLKDIYR